MKNIQLRVTKDVIRICSSLVVLPFKAKNSVRNVKIQYSDKRLEDYTPLEAIIDITLDDSVEILKVG